MSTTHLAGYITREFSHEAFYNADNESVSFYMPEIGEDRTIIGEQLLTVRTYVEADEICKV